jgi:hypothetical protein
LLALGGAQAWLGPGAALVVPTLPFDTLALLAPALGFFGAPESMGRVHARVSIWWGTEDELCPRTDVEHTLAALGDRGALRVAEGAGHFSFMHAQPPGVRGPLPDRARFLEALRACVTCSDSRSDVSCRRVWPQPLPLAE